MRKNLLFILSLAISLPIFSQADSLSRLKLLFVGDIMGHGPQIQSAYNAATKSYDYEPCFQFVKPIIEKADLAIGNLEVTLSDQGQYTGYPMFKSPDALADALKNAGFDILMTANNHSNDNRAYGVTHTIEVLKDRGFYQTGTFKNQSDRDMYYPLIVYKDDFRLAFLNYTYDTNGMPTTAPTIVNLIDENLMKKDLAFAKKLEPDAIIVMMHWGLEYQLSESKVQQDLAQKLFSWGADLVIGAHPHVVQPIKYITFTDEQGLEQQGLTVYSLGNFISNQQQPNTDVGLMVEIELTKPVGKNGATVGTCEYIPLWRYLDKRNAKQRYGTYYTLPIAAFEEGNPSFFELPLGAKTTMVKNGNRIREVLEKHSGKERIVTLAEIDKPSETSVFPKGSTLKSVGNSYVKKVNFAVADTGRFNKIIPIPSENPYIETKQETTPPAAPVIENTSKDGSYLPPQNTTPTPDKPVRDKYWIQFQATRNLYTENLPYSDAFVRERNGLFLYFVSGGNSLDIAKNVLSVVHEKFPDAYIVQREIIEKTLNIPNAYSENTTKGFGESTYIPQKKYRIQFQSSRRFVTYNNLPFGTYEVIENNGWFRYYTGNATSLEDAQNLLKVVQNAGYKDAFVVPF